MSRLRGGASWRDHVAGSVALAVKDVLLDGFVLLRPQGRRSVVQRLAAPACHPRAPHALVPWPASPLLRCRPASASPSRNSIGIRIRGRAGANLTPCLLADGQQRKTDQENEYGFQGRFSRPTSVLN